MIYSSHPEIDNNNPYEKNYQSEAQGALSSIKNYKPEKNTDIILNNTFFLGVYPGITNEKMDYVIECIEEFFKNLI